MPVRRFLKKIPLNRFLARDMCAEKNMSSIYGLAAGAYILHLFQRWLASNCGCLDEGENDEFCGHLACIYATSQGV